jgi:hypothetical protein
MKLKKYFLIITLFIFTFNSQAQIKNMDDFMVNTEELRMLTQRIAKNYIMNGILPGMPKIENRLKADSDKFSETLVNLTDSALNEEIEIELQKLNLSWMLLNRILQQKYDTNAAAKVVKYADKMSDEIETIADMVNNTTKLKSVKLLRLSSNGRMLSQKLLLYYIAAKAKVRDPEIPDKFNQTKADLYDVIKTLTNQSESDPDLKTDSGVLMYVEMIRDSYDKVRKTISIDSKVHPKTANMIVNQMTDNFQLLTDIFYEKFN